MLRPFRGARRVQSCASVKPDSPPVFPNTLSLSLSFNQRHCAGRSQDRHDDRSLRYVLVLSPRCLPGINAQILILLSPPSSLPLFENRCDQMQVLVLRDVVRLFPAVC